MKVREMQQLLRDLKDPKQYDADNSCHIMLKDGRYINEESEGFSSVKSANVEAFRFEGACVRAIFLRHGLASARLAKKILFG